MHNDAHATPCDTQDASTRDHSKAPVADTGTTHKKKVSQRAASLSISANSFRANHSEGRDPRSANANSVQHAQNESASNCSATWSNHTDMSLARGGGGCPLSLNARFRARSNTPTQQREGREMAAHTHTCIPAQKQPHTHCARS